MQTEKGRQMEEKD